MPNWSRRDEIFPFCPTGIHLIGIASFQDLIPKTFFMTLFISHTVTPYWIASCSHVSCNHTFTTYFLLYIKVLMAMAMAMFVGFEVLTVVVMKIYIFRDTTLLKVN
jgi:hypothetical protein